MPGFFRCWTRKEAYIKAVGKGLSFPLDQVQVTLLMGTAPRFLQLGTQPEEAAAWSLHHLEPAPGYVGALAYRGAARVAHLDAAVEAQELLDRFA